MSEPVISTRRLTKAYDATPAVDRLDLQVERGEIFGLLGPNGAGKTTTVLMLLGLCEPTAGTARVLGLDPTSKATQVKRHVGYVPDSVGFYPGLTGRQNLRYTARLNGLGRRAAEQRIAEVLDQVGMDESGDQRTDTYSRGMSQRLGIADALLKDPAVMILDEPTIAIDPAGVSRILSLIRTLRDEHAVTVLLSSHLLHQVQSVCDRVGIFVRGRLVATGSVAALAQQLSGGHTAIEVGVAGDSDAAADTLRTHEAVREVDRDGQLLVAACERDARREIAELLTAEQHTLVHLAQRSGQLDEVYHRYFREETNGRR